ncbi:MAG: toll/interleukin-1 receptor domain-containing protein, partial [Anaerolineae bacterium]|nr:toll/interleukin-1 receptor domain-containing protein [Anaerolineae bacterium]
MQRHFGEGNVFLDVGEIPFGVDFRVYLREQIAEHDVVLVLIGPKWGDIMRERASQANDFVRIEIENALAQNKLVIPTLVMRLE